MGLSPKPESSAGGKPSFQLHERAAPIRSAANAVTLAWPDSSLARHTQPRQADAVHPLPPLPTAPPNSRSAWSAPACRRCRRETPRPETSDPAPAFHKRPEGLLARLHYPFEGRISPRPDGNDSIGRPGSTRAKGRAKGVPPSDAVERVPPRPDGVAAVPPFGGRSGLRSIRWDNIRWGRQVPLCLRSGTATTRLTSGCAWTWSRGAFGCTSMTDWAR